MRRLSRKAIILIATLAVVIATVLSVSIYAAIARTSSRGNIEVTSASVTVETTYTSSTSSFDWTFSQAGEQKNLSVKLKNTSGTEVHRYYQIELTEALSTNLASAILVYYNGKYISTLAELAGNGTEIDINDTYAFMAKGMELTDTITFELHQAADNSIFDGKVVKFKVTTYTESFDNTLYQLVSTKEDFDRIMTDINSGFLDIIPTIVLMNDITQTKAYTVACPLTIQTNGHTLTSTITLNDDETTNPDALITVLGSGTVGVTAGTYYDKEGARELVASYAQEALKYGIKAGATPEVKDIIGPYSFYGLAVAVDGSATFSSPTLTGSSDLTYTKAENITFTLDGQSVVSYNHIGKNTDFDEEHILSHMPAEDAIITHDLFLPTSVPGTNASITWKSSNTSVISEDGRIVDAVWDREEITLTAIIKVNAKTYTRTYTFKVTSNNNYINFLKLVKEISPLIIKKKYSESDEDNTTYYLPIVTEYDSTKKKFGTYDYRSSYTSPKEEPTIDWTSHEDIKLTSLTYSKYYDGTAESPIDTYDYITVTGNAVTLTKDTLSNYAKINVTGKFSNNEEYTMVVSVSIALGSDTELLEKAFNNVDNMLTGVSVLGNIIKTRKASGMSAESGDFYLPAEYGDSYTIAYEVADSSGIISIGEAETIDGVSYYKFIVNPSKFNSVETSVPVRATVTYTKSDETEITKTKIIYIETPAAVHIADLGNVSIFNSLKYQVVNTIPASEKAKGSSGFSGDSIVTYTGDDYILLRDMVGDAEYLKSYASDDLYLTMNDYLANGSDGATGVTSIKLYGLESNDSNITDTLAYDFIRLIQWSTGNTKVTAASVLSDAGKAKLTSAMKSYVSNGETYLTEKEIDVLEAFYKACTGDDGTKWNSIKNQALETAPGRIYDNANLLVTILNCLTTERNTNTGWYENTGSNPYGMIYAKYLEVVNRYAITTSENEEPMAPAQEVYNSKFYYSFTETAEFSTASTATNNVSIPCRYYNAQGVLVDGYCNRYANSDLPQGNEFRYTGSGSNKRHGTYAATNKRGDVKYDLYANTSGYPYDSDHTKYITSAELMVLKAFWLAAISNTNVASSNNVLHTFSDTSKAAIASALAVDSNGNLPYPDYDADDFTYYGQAILNAFDACLVIPTTFTSNGIGALINDFYDNMYGDTSCEHTWNSGTITTYSTRTATGVYTYTCEKCSATKTQTIPAIGVDNLVYFTNPAAWTTVYAYAWNSETGEKNAAWPGIATTYTGVNDESDKGIHVVEIDFSKYDKIIFNNGDGNGQQTVDITIDKTNTNGYYVSGGSGTALTVGTWYQREAYVPCTSHVWDSGTVVTAASETSLGTTRYTCTICGETKTEGTNDLLFKSKLVDGVPAVTNLDNLEGALSYFSKLTTLEIVGNSTLSIFLSDYGLSNAFARITLTNDEITSLKMQYVSPEWNTFDLTNIKNLDKLTSMDLSNNLGIKTVNPLLNTNRNNYTEVKITNIGEVYEYNAFVIDNLGEQCTVYYSAADNTATSATSKPSSVLVNLSGIEDLVSEHLYLTNVIYKDDGSTTDVVWRVEDGNAMASEEINQGGELDKIETVNEMNMRVSPYFYCNTSFSIGTTNFVAKHLYKITYDSDNALQVSDVSGSLYSIDIVDDTHAVESTTLTDTTGEEVNIINNDEYDRVSTPTSTTNVIYSQDVSAYVGSNQTYHIYMYYQIFRFQAYNEGSIDGLSTTGSNNYYYLMANGTELKAGYTATPDDSCYMVILTESQAKFVDYLYNNGNEISGAQMTATYGVTADDSNNVYLGIKNLNEDKSGVYIYNVKEKKFLNSGGFDNKLGDLFNITKSSSSWYIQDVQDSNKTKYLDCFKQTIYAASVYTNVISAVFNGSAKTTGVLTTEQDKKHAKLYNSSWSLSTNNVDATSTIGSSTYDYSASVNTPTIVMTTQEGKKYTATFNCYTIRNARQTSAYTNPITKTIGSQGYVYDNGATLLLSISSTQPTDYSYYFCLLTSTDITRLNAWYTEPTKNETFGNSVSREAKSEYEYYIYNPYTRRYATGSFNDTSGSPFSTTSVKPSYGFRLGYYTSSKDGNGTGYSISQLGSGNNIYVTATDVTQSNFTSKRSSLYYVPTNSTTVTSASGTTYSSSLIYYYKKTSTNGYYLKSWNAYGGISDSCYGIAQWGIDSGSLWVFDDVTTENQYTYTYQEASKQSSNISYELSYTINLVTAHIDRSEISRYYEFDKYYYLDKDTTIDGNVYKAGGLIRFEFDAYYGKKYQANILYYEVVFSYTNGEGITKTITNPKDLSFLYYVGDGVGSAGEIKYFNCTTDSFEEYRQGFQIYFGESSPLNSTVTYDTIHWIYTEDSFNEVKDKLYDDIYGLTKATTYVDGSRYYTPDEYQAATVFAYIFGKRRDDKTLYLNASGDPIPSTTAYDTTTNYYEIGTQQISNTELRATRNETVGDTTVAISLFDYYKFGIYSNTSGTPVPYSATYNAGTTYYFKSVDDNGNVIYTTTRPRVYNDIIGDYVTLTLNEDTFEYFKNTLTYVYNGTQYTVEQTSELNSDYTYYRQAFVVSDFRQEILDTYQSVLFNNAQGSSVAIDDTFNPNRTYYTYQFEEVTVNATDFETYKSVLYSDMYGTALPSDATYSATTKYYRRKLVESSPEPSGNTENEWVSESNVTRLYSHVKKADAESDLDTYKDDYTNIAYTRYPIMHQYIGSSTESENIYSEPSITEVYEPVLGGYITETNWDSKKASIYIKSVVGGETIYTSCSDKAWSETYSKITFYQKTLETVSNITTGGITYQTDAGYRLGTSSSNIFGVNDSTVLVWGDPIPGAQNTGGTMDDILLEANHFYNTSQYNQYYGKHYAYNGFSMESSLDGDHIVKDGDNYVNSYENKNVYRLVVNPEKNGFMWERVYTYDRKTGAQMVTDASTGVATVDSVVWATEACFGSFYTGGKFYRVVEDDFTKTLNVIQFTDVIVSAQYQAASVTTGAVIPEYTYYEYFQNTYTLTSDAKFVSGKTYYTYVEPTGPAAKYTDIQSQKIRYIYQSNYLGYAGNFEIVISAVACTKAADGTYTYSDTVRTYKIKFVGAVIK